MSLNIVKLHQLIDQWAADERATQETPAAAEAEIVAEPVRITPEGQRVVRTKTQGDRVFLLDDNKKTRQWLTKPEIVGGVGFSMADVQEVDETEFLKYNMGAAIYRLPDATT